MRTFKRTIWLALLAAVVVGTVAPQPVLAQAKENATSEAQPPTPPGEEAPAQPAAQNPEPGQPAPAGEAPTEEPEEAPLPKLADLLADLPSAESLLNSPPVDWIVLNNPNEEVIIAEPVYPRPDTLAKLSARIDELKKKKVAPEELEQHRREMRDAGYISVFLPAAPDAEAADRAEYQIKTSLVKKIIYHEELLLMRIDTFMDAGDFRRAYEMLFSMERSLPDWPTIPEHKNRLLMMEAEARLQKGDSEEALVLIEELFGRAPDYPNARRMLGSITDTFISEAIAAEDYRRARHFLARISATDPSSSTAEKWNQQLPAQGDTLLRQALDAFNAKNYPDASRLVKAAALIWPKLPGLQDADRRITIRFQSLDVGVLSFPGEPTPYFLPTAADDRERKLTEAELFEVNSVDAFAHFTTSFFEQWEPTDLGRRAVFTLRQNRQYWESQPPVTASTVVAALAGRLDPKSPTYDERFDSYVKTLAVESPYEFEVRFKRVPLRPEPLFALPIPEARQDEDAGASLAPAQKKMIGPFELASEDASTRVYRRTIPEPDNAPQFHVAQVIERRYPDWPAAYRALLRGDVAMLPNVRGPVIPQFIEDRRFFVQQMAVPVTHLIQFNPKSVPLKNRELRNALACAINREEILGERLLEDPQLQFGRLITGPFPTQSAAYQSLLEQRPFDPTLSMALALAAKKILKTEIPKLRMICDPDPDALVAAKAIIEDWARVKIEVELVTDPAQAESWDILYRTVRMETPAIDLWPLLTLETGARVESLAQLPDWLRQKLLQLDEAADENSTVNLLRKLHRDLQAEVALIPLWEIDEFLLLRKTSVSGFPERPVQPYQDVVRWTIAPWYPTDTP